MATTIQHSDVITRAAGGLAREEVMKEFPVVGLSRRRATHEITCGDARDGAPTLPQAHVASTPTTAATFIDLFCGIGGFRLAFEAAGATCSYACDIDGHAARTYMANGGHTVDVTDIHVVDALSIPDFDILTAGFPCVGFSLAGVSKRNSLGRKHGLEGDQGDLFFEVTRILEARRPRAFLLENVANLVHHDRGRTFQTIMSSLCDLGYDVSWALLDAARLVPQHRERVYIAGFRDDTSIDFDVRDITLPDLHPRLGDVLEADVPDECTISDRAWDSMRERRQRHARAGNGFGYKIANPDGVAPTLIAHYAKGGGDILIDQGAGRNPRKLTVRECARLMGFPEWFEFPVARTHAYRQLGNAVCVPVVSVIAEQMIVALGRGEA